MKAAEVVVRALEREGVGYIFGIPGEENLDLLDAIANSNIRLVVTRHEQAAGFMAATCGRLTGKAGVCLSTLGPGATNLVTAAAFAQLGGMPMLMITGQKPIKKSKQGEFQILDVVNLMKPITKYSRQIVSPEQAAVMVRKAFKHAESERPGAVHLELPEDIAGEQIETPYFFSVEKERRPVAEEKTLQKAAEMIMAATRPLILIGGGCNRKLVTQGLANLIRKTGLYFINTQMGKGPTEALGDKYIGTAALSDGDYVHCAIDRADLIVNVGYDVIEKPPFFMRPDSITRVIHVNFSRAEMDTIYFPHLEVTGDIGNSLWQLHEMIEKQDHWDFSYFEDVRQRVREHIFKKSLDEGFPLKPQRIVADVHRALPQGAIVSLDNGMYKLWFARNFACTNDMVLLLDNALATMGAGLPNAIAAKILNPEKKVVVIAGDGGFLMNSQELETAIRLELDLVILVLRDDAFGMIKWKQNSLGFKEYGLDFKNPDFVQYAQSYGAKGYRIGTAGELYDCLKKCINEKGVHILEVPIDYSENDKMTEELRKLVCML